MPDLKFNRTLSLKEFGTEKKSTSLNVIKNPNTGKMFFSTNVAGISGKVSTKFDASEEACISECTDEASGETFFMLHNKVENANIEHIFALV
jgi:hypothetical protein